MFKYIVIIFFLSNFLFSKELKDINLQLSWKYQFQFAGYIVAKEKGFYKDAGFDVSLKEWNGKSNVAKDLSQNIAEYAVLNSSSMIDIANGKNIVYLATIFQSSPLILLANRNSKIRTIYDLKNKQIVTAQDLSKDVSLLSMIFSHKIKIDNFIQQDPNFDVEDLLGHRIDAVITYISNEPYILKKLKLESIIFDPKDFGFDFYSDILSVNENYLMQNKDEVDRFLKASLKGWEYAFSNINETVDIIYSKYNSQNKEKAALLYEATELKKLAYNKNNALGEISKEQIEKIYNVYTVLGLIKNRLNIEKIIYKTDEVDSLLSKDEKNYLKNNSFKMCINSNFMPYEKLDKDGNYSGIVADYYYMLEKILSVKFDFVKSSNQSESLKLLSENRCDFVSFVIKDAEQSNSLNNTNAIFKVPLVLATRLGSIFVDGINNLNDKKVAIPKFYLRALNNFEARYPNLNIVEVDSTNEGLKMLKNGEVDVFIGTLYSTSYKVQTEYYKSLKIFSTLDENIEFVISVNENKGELLNILRKVVDSISNEDLEFFADRWATTVYEKSLNYTLFWQIVLGFVVIFIFGAFFFIKLKILNSKLYDKERFINTILNLQPNMIYIVNKNQVVFANRYFLDFFRCKDLQEFKDKYDCLAKTFIKEEPFFYFDNVDKNWVDTLLKLNFEDIVVSIYDNNAKINKSLNLSIVKLENEDYLISLTDISDTISKQIKLEEKATHDNLTGLFNRDYFVENYKTMLDSNGGKIIAFAVLDIDFFKRVNDNFGHDVGDLVLKKFAQIVKNLSDEYQFFVRWGGEEFVLLFEVKDLTTIYDRLDSIRLAIKNAIFEYVGTITCSIGGTIYKDDEDIQNTFKRADEALYEAKNSGRDKVVIKLGEIDEKRFN